ncbi:hypothetical protein [Sphaerimonospora thailandensis]|uniref:hypothetical protein n=1 Tax=Sphaerimonospora thailandensis TaxID=795644 RepID=UPI001EF3A497|nr:hypothetical protein [Sphaerimonospora thailandensis]
MAAEEAGACRTVDGDDLRELCQAIARQESIAEIEIPEPDTPPNPGKAGGLAATA